MTSVLAERFNNRELLSTVLAAELIARHKNPLPYQSPKNQRRHNEFTLYPIGRAIPTSQASLLLESQTVQVVFVVAEVMAELLK